MQVPYILIISPPFPQQSKPSYSTAKLAKKQKKYIQKLPFKHLYIC